VLELGVALQLCGILLKTEILVLLPVHRQRICCCQEPPSVQQTIAGRHVNSVVRCLDQAPDLTRLQRCHHQPKPRDRRRERIDVDAVHTIERPLH